MDRTKKLWASTALGILALVLAAPLSGGIAGAAPPAGELEFAGDTAAYAAGQAAVPVECVDGPTGFCSGTLTLSARDKRSTSTFSVQAGHRETVFVPLPGDGGRPTKVKATATTIRPLGPAVTRSAILHLH